MAQPGHNTLKYAVVNANTAADATIVPAVAGRQIVVLSYCLVLGGIVAVTWKSGATPLSGPMGAGAACVINADGAPEQPQFETAIGAALILGLSAAIQVSGHIAYIEV